MKKYSEMSKKELIDELAYCGFDKYSIKDYTKQELIDAIEENKKAVKMSITELAKYLDINGLM